MGRNLAKLLENIYFKKIIFQKLSSTLEMWSSLSWIGQTFWWLDKLQYAETGGIDWSKFDELKGQMKQMEDRLRDEKSKVEWRLGEVTQFWNDAKWK